MKDKLQKIVSDATTSRVSSLRDYSPKERDLLSKYAPVDAYACADCTCCGASAPD